MSRVEELLQTLSLDELATLVIAILQTENSGAVVPVGSTDDESLFVAVNGDEAKKVHEYWESVFGDATTQQAVELIELYRQNQQFDKMKDHERAYERAREAQKEITDEDAAPVPA